MKTHRNKQVIKSVFYATFISMLAHNADILFHIYSSAPNIVGALAIAAILLYSLKTDVQITLPAVILSLYVAVAMSGHVVDGDAAKSFIITKHDKAAAYHFMQIAFNLAAVFALLFIAKRWNAKIIVISCAVYALNLLIVTIANIPLLIHALNGVDVPSDMVVAVVYDTINAVQVPLEIAVSLFGSWNGISEYINDRIDSNSNGDPDGMHDMFDCFSDSDESEGRQV